MTAPVYLESLDVTDYRNYAALHLALGAGRFIVAGDNAQGKSNLCEAIRLLATMRSFRAGSDRELVRWGSDGHFARIAADVARVDGPLHLEMIISAPPTPGDPLIDPSGLWPAAPSGREPADETAPGERAVAERANETAPGERAVAERANEFAPTGVPPQSPPAWTGLPAPSAVGEQGSRGAGFPWSRVPVERRDDGTTGRRDDGTMGGSGVGLPPLPPMPGARVAAGKRIKVNGAPRRAIDCVGLMTVVLFEPVDLDLVIGPPAGRRHFMDVTLCQISRSYCRALSQLQRVLTQRGALLRRIRDNQDDPRALEYWDTQLATLAVPIITERAGLITRCTPTADDVALRLGGRGLRLEYQPSYAVDAELPAATSAAAFIEKLHALRKREIAQGVNLLGPHRDDLAFWEGPMNVATYGSRGQQRGAALALKLAELEAIELETGDQPILVLDDVLSELDPTRRAALLGSIAEISQVILTTAEPEAIPANFADAARWLHVSQGTIRA
jgi:DNA replication and repair protein RecF